MQRAVYSPQPRPRDQSVKDLIVEIATAALLIYEPACRCLGDEGLHSLAWARQLCDVGWGRLWGLMEYLGATPGLGLGLVCRN